MFRYIQFAFLASAFLWLPNALEGARERGHRGHRGYYHRVPHHRVDRHPYSFNHRGRYFQPYNGPYGYRSGFYFSIVPGFEVVIPLDRDDQRKRFNRDYHNWRYPDNPRYRDRRRRGN
jgi:hypothetical protein